MKQYVPAWWIHVGEDAERVNDTFRSVLADASISQRELAERLGVYQSTISRWKSGERRPSLAEIGNVLRVVVEATAEKQRKAELAAQVVKEVLEAVRAGEQYGLVGEPELRRKQKKAGKRLAHLLDEAATFVSASGSATAKGKARG